MQYELLGGMHDENKKTYKRGDVFESKHDLIAMFPQKFKKVSGTVEAAPAPPIPAPKKLTPKKDDTQKEDPVTAPEADAGGDPVEAKPSEVPEGKDVSGDFPTADKVGMEVYKVTPRRFNIIDPSDGGAVVNESPLPKDKVEELLKTYLED